MAQTSQKYNSSINIVGSIPDYATMIDYIVATQCASDGSDMFVFRTAKATSRFKKAVSDGFLSFASDAHKELFLSALSNVEISNEEKMMVLFWQFAYCNQLFSEITDNVFLRALYSGRTSISKSDVLAFLRHLKLQKGDELPFSDSTIDTISSKYLTLLKKFGLADGTLIKEIRAPHISSNLFVYLVRFALTAYPDDNTLNNPMFRFSFLEPPTIINRLKTIEYIPYWDMTQVANDVTITLK